MRIQTTTDLTFPVRIELTREEANDFVVDDFNTLSEEIKDRLREKGFGVTTFKVEGQIMVTLNFYGTVEGRDRDEASDNIRTGIHEGSIEISGDFYPDSFSEGDPDIEDFDLAGVDDLIIDHIEEDF